MEEKERYVIDYCDDIIFDTEKGYYPSGDTICKTLNQQDKRIKELEEDQALLTILISGIDNLMHDKDYRFENANGTWYSRESCRDLTNEEVFEELRTELRQFADLEAKLAEKSKENATLEAMLVENANDRKTMQEFKIGEDGYDLTDEDARNSLCWEVEELKQQLEEKDEEIEKLTEELDDKNFCKDFVDLYTENKLKIQMLHENWKDKISFTIGELEKVKSAFGLINSKLDKVETIKEYIHYIDHQINELKEMK